jgi:hypothetical protein
MRKAVRYHRKLTLPVEWHIDGFNVTKSTKDLAHMGFVHISRQLLNYNLPDISHLVETMMK